MTRRGKFCFGPVSSRRLGRSLGIDPVPPKTCTYDCVYCQLGESPAKTAAIMDYASPGEILKELEGMLRGGAEPDYITLSGSGEPTLNRGIGEIISGIKKLSTRPVCVITNGSLLSKPDVREKLLEADLVIPSLDAGDEKTFRKINRPHESIKFDEMLSGIAEFSKEFPGELRLEIMLVKGLNDSAEAVKKLAPLVRKINPAAGQLNTVVRPPASPGAKGSDAETLERAAGLLGVKTEIITPPAAPVIRRVAGTLDEVLGIIRRRPSTAEDIALYLGLNMNEALKSIARLLEEEKILPETAGGKTHYRPNKRAKSGTKNREGEPS